MSALDLGLSSKPEHFGLFSLITGVNAPVIFGDVHFALTMSDRLARIASCPTRNNNS